MIDTFGRSITYLRVSVTELCNLRCRYCMPEDGVCKKEHADMLTEDELIQAVEAAAALGITKLRITGGEPLVKKNILSICRRASRVSGIREVCLTTNGILLPELARPLKEAGVSRLNLSLDTLDPQKYAHITRNGSLDDFWKGFHAALDADFQKIKLNAVLIGGFNDDEILPLAELTRKYPVDMRFIEMMPMCDSSGFGPEAYIPFTRVLEALPEAVPAAKDGGVAKLFHLPGALGNIGLISPVSAHFCGECNRIRLTADGKVKPCLHSNAEYPLKGLDFDGMKAQLEAAYNKQQKEIAQLKDFVARNKARVATRNMAMSRQKKLDKMDVIELASEKPKPEFNFKLSRTPSRYIFQTKDLVIGYNEPLSTPLNLEMERGQKIVLTGANGIGKTTLLKSILGLIPSISGTVEQGDYLNIGYFEQEMTGDGTKTCIETLWDEFPSFSQYEVRSALAKCGLTTKHIESQVRVLSGGEQAKVRLCKLINRETNVLLLDEPTNHLDTDAKDELKRALIDYNGSILMVCHEPDFYDGLATDVWDCTRWTTKIF